MKIDLGRPLLASEPSHADDDNKLPLQRLVQSCWLINPMKIDLGRPLLASEPSPADEDNKHTLPLVRTVVVSCVFLVILGELFLSWGITTMLVIAGCCCVVLYIYGRGSDRSCITDAWKHLQQRRCSVASKSAQAAAVTKHGAVLVVGAEGVGKKCLVSRSAKDVGGDNVHQDYKADLRIAGENVSLMITVASGAKKWQPMIRSYFRHPQVCLLCFDLSNMKTFTNAQLYKTTVADFRARENLSRCAFILVGTKSDQAEADQTAFSKVQSWAEATGVPFVCTSSNESLSPLHELIIKTLFHHGADKCLRRKCEMKLSDTA